MWEVFTNGIVPYIQYSDHDTWNLIVQGKKLEKPADCSDEIYNIMLSCWAPDERNRPSFDEIYKKLDMELANLDNNNSTVIELDSKNENQNTKTFTYV